MESHNTYSFATSFVHIFKVHPYCSMHQYFISFHRYILLYCVDILPHSILFIQPSADGHRGGCSYFLAIMNMLLLVYDFLCVNVFIPLRYVNRSANSWVNAFWGMAKPSSKMAAAPAATGKVPTPRPRQCATGRPRDEKQYLTVGFSCIFLLNNIKHFLMCLKAICIPLEISVPRLLPLWMGCAAEL